MREENSLVTQYVGNLLREHLSKCPDSKITERRNCFVSFCNHFGKFDIHQVNKEALENWFLKIKRENNYTNRSLNATRAGINHFFKYLVSESIILRNPLDGVYFDERRTPKKRQRVILSPEEIKEMLELMKEFSPVLYPYIFTLAHTGARLAEIRKLKWDKINFESDHIYLMHTKNGKERRLPIRNGVKEFLQELKQERANISDYVFINQWNKLLSAGQILDTIVAFQKKHPMQKRWRCHDLRHSFAHNFLKKKGEMYALQAILGHSSIKMTIDLYGQMKACDVEMINPYE
ncbi:MAG: tyrosine-type recombinase/integrase [Oligoflexia bacterium]|nr:tyrosine-type recombinase/integrase [Oligoflexia bacterium]